VELPRLQPLYEKFRDRGVQFIALEATRDTEGAQKFIKENKLSYVFLENGEGKNEIVRSLFHVRVFPTSLLIDQEGRVVGCHIDYSEGDDARFESEIQGLLG